MSTLVFDEHLCVRNERGRSGLWRVFARKGREDVYVTSPEFHSSLKISLHESGACHAAYSSADEREAAETDWVGDTSIDRLPPHLALRKFDDASRFYERWVARESMPGFSSPLQIAVPVDSLRPMPIGALHSLEVRWIAATAPGTATVISVAFTRTPVPSGHWPGKQGPGTTLVASHQFPSGRTAWLLGIALELTQRDKNWLAGCASEPVSSARAESADAAGMEVSRVIVPCVDEAGGVLALWDIGSEARAG